MPLLPLLLSALACAGRAPDPPAAGVAESLGEEALDGDWRGVSGLDLADGWVGVEERGARLLVREFQRELRAVPIQGLPEGLDLEAVALAEDGLWLGTEAGGRREQERLLRVVPEGESARVVQERSVSYAPFGLQGQDNKGLEGLCAAGGSLLATSEVTAERDGRRWAPAWLLAPGGEDRPLWLGLRTGQGKLSGLACALDGTREDADLRVWGIERHYGVRRILQWRIPQGRIPPGPALAEIAPEADWDLDPALPGSPNPEGLALAGLDPDGAVRLLLVTDNDHGGVQGPTRLVRLRLAPSAGAH